MTSADDIALDFLERLLAGERGQLPLYLAMLLEKSSPCDHGDEHYRQILPSELAELRLSPQLGNEIVGRLCEEIARNPDQALVFTISVTGSDRAIKTAVHILSNPPRQLAIGESGSLLALLNCYLPYRLEQYPGFLEKSDLERLVQIAEELSGIEEIGAGQERSARIYTRMHAAQLLSNLRRPRLPETSTN